MTKKINFEQAKELGWCWFYNDERTAQLQRYAANKPEWSALDILRLPSDEVTDKDKLYAVLCEELIDEKILHTLACDFAEQALSRIENPHPDSIKAIEVKRRWIRGDATGKELAAARAVAWAARAAARDAARDAARAARAAARDAARDAARAAAWAAAWATEESWQVAHVIEVLEGSRCKKG